MLKVVHQEMVLMEQPIPTGDQLQPNRLSISYKNQGFTYIGVLIILAVMMTALGAATEVWHSVMQREKEQELLFVGHQFRDAIGEYYARSGNRFPPNLEALLESSNLGPKKVRFLRKLYIDPMTGNNKWGLVTGLDAKVTGVYSLSEEKPFKTSGFINADIELEKAETYADWKFVYIPKTQRQGLANGVVNGIVRPQPRVR